MIKEDHFCFQLEHDNIDRVIQLDIYLPLHSLAFEYQGEQHFYDIFTLGSEWNQKQRDIQKRAVCLDNHITLIEVPYWWDFSKSTLLSTLFLHRPDLVPTMEGDQIIQDKPSAGFPQGNFWNNYQTK